MPQHVLLFACVTLPVLVKNFQNTFLCYNRMHNACLKKYKRSKRSWIWTSMHRHNYVSVTRSNFICIYKNIQKTIESTNCNQKNINDMRFVFCYVHKNIKLYYQKLRQCSEVELRFTLYGTLNNKNPKIRVFPNYKTTWVITTSNFLSTFIIFYYWNIKIA